MSQLVDLVFFDPCFFFNPVTRYHIFSWIKYCIKWRKDFIQKLLIVIGSLPASRAHFKTPAGYKLDFFCI